jgi:hypothetical protein
MISGLVVRWLEGLYITDGFGSITFMYGGFAMKLNIKAAACTGAIVWGFGLFVLTWWLIMFNESLGDKTFIGKIYRGYEVTATGSFIGLGWGLADGFVGGAIVAWVYNLFVGGQVAKQDA